MARAYFKRGSPEAISREKKKDKKSQSNTTIEDSSTIVTKSGEEYIDHRTGERAWYSEAAIYNIASQCYEYCRDEPRCIKITQFLTTKAINRTQWHNWVAKYPRVSQIHNLCLQIMGDRREVGMSFKEMDRESQLRVLHRYDETWLDINKYWAEMKKDENASENQGTFMVNMVTAPSSSIVPPLRKKTYEESEPTQDVQQDTTETDTI